MSSSGRCFPITRSATTATSTASCPDVFSLQCEAARSASNCGSTARWLCGLATNGWRSRRSKHPCRKRHPSQRRPSRRPNPKSQQPRGPKLGGTAAASCSRIDKLLERRRPSTAREPDSVSTEKPSIRSAGQRQPGDLRISLPKAFAPNRSPQRCRQTKTPAFTGVLRQSLRSHVPRFGFGHPLGRDPSRTRSPYHPVSDPPLEIGHFYLADHRTFLFGVDMALRVAAQQPYQSARPTDGPTVVAPSAAVGQH